MRNITLIGAATLALMLGAPAAFALSPSAGPGPSAHDVPRSESGAASELGAVGAFVPSVEAAILPQATANAPGASWTGPRSEDYRGGGSAGANGGH